MNTTTSEAPFSLLAGRWERHLQRKNGNPLFGSPGFSAEAIRQAQQSDKQEVSDFMQSFQQLVMEVVNLQANVESDVILQLKSRLDQAWEKSTTLAGEQTELQDAIAKLLAVIMQSVRSSAGDDPKAQNELQQEDEARQVHFNLLQHRLIGDLLDPDSLITADELLPVLLSEKEDAFYAALDFFDDEQRTQLYQQGVTLLQQLQAKDLALPQAWSRLKALQSSPPTGAQQ